VLRQLLQHVKALRQLLLCQPCLMVPLGSCRLQQQVVAGSGGACWELAALPLMLRQRQALAPLLPLLL
jgi:hypothetical protein